MNLVSVPMEICRHVETLSEVTNKETLILGKLEIPRRSEFYHLKPIGVGTPYVESLSGYASRLAQEHFLPLSALLKHIIPSTPLLGHRFTDYSRTTLGASTATLSFIKALEALTMRRDLTWTTMVTWVNVLPRLSLIRLKKAWCPACYETWKEKGEVVYDPLLWAIEAVTVCPIHIALLTSSCPTCTTEIPHIARRSRPGFCSRCKSWLGRPLESSRLNRILELGDNAMLQIWKAEATGKLLACAPKITAPARANVKLSLRYCVDKYYWGKSRRFTSQFKLSRGLLRGWLDGIGIPILNTILELTYRQGISP